MKIFLYLLAVCATVYALERTSVLQLKNGKVRGIVDVVDGHKVNFYQGIKYGFANRFELSKPVAPWTEVYDANISHESCPQFGSIISPFYPSPQSEDCLFLNVWAPAEHKANRSVIVYIHGGGFEAGSVFLNSLNGKNVAAQGDLVMVTINYRLSALGFLAGGGVPGNMGLHDQILALKWVQENIHFFGGDPGQVTIWGGSAGSISVGALVLSPLANGLFKRAFMESGSPLGLELTHSKSRMLDKTKLFATKVGCPAVDLTETVTCLRNKTIFQLQEGTFDDLAKNDVLFVPIYGDDVLPISPAQALKEGKFNKVDLLYGVSRDEGSYFAPMIVPELLKEDPSNMTIITAKQQIVKMINFFGHKYAQEVADFYTENVDPVQTNLKLLVASVWGDYNLVCPTILFAEQMVKSSPNNHFYAFRFMHPADSAEDKFPGVPHGAEGAYFWLSVPKVNETDPEGQKARKLSEDMFHSLVGFVKTGNPGNLGGSGQVWAEAFDKTNKDFVTRFVNLDTSGYKMIDKYFEKACDTFWKPKLFN